MKRDALSDPHVIFFPIFLLFCVGCGEARPHSELSELRESLRRTVDGYLAQVLLTRHLLSRALSTGTLQVLLAHGNYFASSLSWFYSDRYFDKYFFFDIPSEGLLVSACCMESMIKESVFRL